MGNFLARYQAAREAEGRERMTHHEPQRHDAPTFGLNHLALGLSPLPIVGDVAGFAADAYDWYQHPENRSVANGLLIGAGLLPFVPPLAAGARLAGNKLMDAMGESRGFTPWGRQGGGLKPGGIDRARQNLEAIARGEKAGAVDLAELTPEQFEGINALRRETGQPEIGSPNALYVGKHHYNSRVLGDQYEIDDLVKQLESSLDDTAIAHRDEAGRVGLMNPEPRADGYGANVNDLASIHWSSSRRDPEVFSVIPKGDLPPSQRKPKKKSP